MGNVWREAYESRTVARECLRKDEENLCQRKWNREINPLNLRPEPHRNGNRLQDPVRLRQEFESSSDSLSDAMLRIRPVIKLGFSLADAPSSSS